MTLSSISYATVQLMKSNLKINMLKYTKVYFLGVSVSMMVYQSLMLCPNTLKYVSWILDLNIRFRLGSWLLHMK